MFKNLILISIALCLSLISNAQVIVVDNNCDSILMDRKIQVVSVLESMFKANNQILGNDSIMHILTHTHYYVVPLYNLYCPSGMSLKQGSSIKVSKRMRPKLHVDYKPDTLFLDLHPNKLAWVFMVYDCYVLGYYHCSSQSVSKNGDFYVVKTIDTTSLKLGIFEYEIKDMQYLSRLDTCFAVYGYLDMAFYYQDVVLFLHRNNQVVGQINALDVFSH